MYSQNNEDDLVLAWFGETKGTLLDIGCNDGMTFSNSKLLIDNGWSGHLLEPSFLAYKKTQDLHKDNAKVHIYNCGIANETGVQKFYESGTLLGQDDYSLVSSKNEEELKRWNGSVKFLETYATFSTWDKWLQNSKLKENETFDFVSIDAEGEDWNILQQIDLKKHGVKILCIEWNSLKNLNEKFTAYATGYGLYEIARNEENILFAINK
jgi:FkbM family methyltransferase